MNAVTGEWCGFKLNYVWFLILSYWYIAEPGDYVAREGEPVDGLYIILDGQVKVHANS
jgi:hypothetical protein